jgi:RNA polymerase sigma-70 factor (sigma-E family)
VSAADGRKDDGVELHEYVADRRQALFRFAVVLTGDPALADDVVAEALARPVEQWARVGAADNVHAYMRKMVLNEYLGWRRRTARIVVRADVGDLLTPTADHADAHADHQQLADELRRLPAKQRAAIVLRYYEGLPYAEIAELLGSGENAVRSNISRGLKRLRVELSEADDARPAPIPIAEVGR